jgi:uncharacterized protein (UPF0303 family)
MTATEHLQADLEILAQQERLLRFTTFDADIAWQLGSLLRSKLVERNAAGTIEIEVNGQVLFACTTLAAQPGQADWIRRKRNTVRRFARSSYAVGRQLALDAQTMEARHGLALADYAAHGGGFPLWLGGCCVGSIVLSGLAQRDDHALVVDALSAVLGVVAPQLV